MSQALDPFDAATEAGNRPDAFFGKLDISAQFVSLKKGERKTTWVEGDDPQTRNTEVTIRLNPLDVTGLTKFIDRQVLAESREWSQTVWASLRDLGIKNVREAHNKWAHVELVKNGRSWEKDGAKVEGTTFKFIVLFDSEAACVAAWETLHGGTKAHSPSSNGTALAASAANDTERAAAMQFLPHIVNANKTDLNKLAQVLASMSPINKYFTVNSPEVTALLGG